MSMLAFTQVCQRSLPLSSNHVAFRGLSTTACLCKNRKSAVPKVTRFQTLPLTYDQAVAPSNIFVRKSWLSWNTVNLEGEKRTAQTTFEDVIVRKFMEGTWHRHLVSEVVIKRRHNMMILSFLVSTQYLFPRQVYFLQGYTEELLTNWLKCIVKVELQTVKKDEDAVFKRI